MAMLEKNQKIFDKNKFINITNRWDWIALIIVLASLVAVSWVAQQMSAPYQPGQNIAISLAPDALPGYALRTVSRMLIGLFCSLLFTFIVGTAAARNKYAEQILIPAIDILQSVPVLGFLSITVTGFVALFPNSLLGPECAAIFAIFAAQVWNITLGFYQSLRTIPPDLQEAAAMLHLSAWQRFWRVEVPFALPSLLWNSMISMSAAWFFVVVSEAITVAGHSITLPGIGSYLALAIQQADKKAVVFAIITMLIVILAYDQLLFRPMVAWAEKFQSDAIEDVETPTPWLTALLQRARLLHHCANALAWLLDKFINNRFSQRQHVHRRQALPTKVRSTLIIFWYALLTSIIFISVYLLSHFIFSHVSAGEALLALKLGLYTSLRVLILIFICSLIWVPIGVWIGLRPRLARIIQPIAQFLAAFPANLFFPVVVMLIVRYQLNVEIFTAPLMILGTQWYILFNVIAGTKALPKELYFAAKNFGVRGWLWWQRLILPAIFPYYITGALSAAGGAWNASIVAEVVSWGDTTLRATGLGEYITHYTTVGDYPRIALGIGVMCLFVTAINRIIWRPLYRLAEQRFQM